MSRIDEIAKRVRDYREYEGDEPTPPRSLLDDIDYLLSQLKDGGAETDVHVCRPCGYHFAVCCQCRRLLPSTTPTETSARCGESDGEDRSCPFCKEQGFDLTGLKSHLNHGDCEGFENTERLQRL